MSVNQHYQEMKLQPVTVMEHWLSKEQLRGFYLGNIIKYVGRFNCRAPAKGGLPDLQKAQDYLNKLIELEGDDG